MDIDKKIARAEARLKNLEGQEKAVANGASPQVAKVQAALKHPVLTKSRQKPIHKKWSTFSEMHQTIVRSTTKKDTLRPTKVEDVYHTLLDFGFPQSKSTLMKSKDHETTTDILMTLRKHNCLSLAMETMDNLYHTDNTYYQIKKNPSNKWLPYSIVSHYTIDPKHAKYAIGQALFHRVLDSVYYTFNPREMKYYDDIPSIFKHHSNTAPMLLVWVLHHYGFDNIIEDIIYKDNAPLHKGSINLKSFSYFSEPNNPAPLSLNVIDAPNADAFFDICKKLNNNVIPTQSTLDLSKTSL